MSTTVEEMAHVFDTSKSLEDMEREIAASELRYQRWARGIGAPR